MVIHKIPDQIINGGLVPLYLPKVNSIVLHHMANPNWDVKDVELYHVKTKGLNAIGYNYWIGFDGTVYEGRGLSTGTHTTGYNETTIGIGFQGNFQSGTKIGLSVMTNEQFNAGVDLIEYLKKRIPTIRKTGGHCDFAEITCPGNTFPLEEMLSGIKRNESATTEVKTVQDALDHIITAGVETDKEFWVKACEHNTYLDKLFIKIANVMKEYKAQ